MKGEVTGWRKAPMGANQNGAFKEKCLPMHENFSARNYYKKINFDKHKCDLIWNKFVL